MSKAHLVLIRFSALGDVALLVPVVQALRQKYPQLTISIVSQGFATALFSPLEVQVYPVDLKQYKGLPGLWRLARKLRRELQPTVVVDMHQVLRTVLLSRYFILWGIPVFTLQKGRKARRKLTRKKDKVRLKLPAVSERYAQLLARAGYPLRFSAQDTPDLSYRHPEVEGLFAPFAERRNLGLAPLARHRAKQWPMEKWEALLQSTREESWHWWLFGAPQEKAVLEGLLERSGASGTVVAGKLPLNGELALMKKLALMVALDSSNMHLATLAGTAVVSLWGGTHPYAGFRPLGRANQELMVQIPVSELGCRPCSTFGNKPCWRGDYACLEQLEVQRVIAKIKGSLTNR